MSWPLIPPSYEASHGHAERIELASDRRIRDRNKVNYRLAHWPIWIFVFFIAPGPLTFELFERGFDRRMVLWLAVVLAVTGIALEQVARNMRARGILAAPKETQT